MKNIKFRKFVIGSNFPVFIIAESGINHNGSLKIAKKMVDAAKKTGVDCIKFQTHIAEEEMIKTSITPGKISKKTLWNIIKQSELSENDEIKLKKYCDKQKILFLSTPFSKKAVDRLEQLKVPAYKIGSGELTNLPFLKYISKTLKPVILSTGMSEISDIRRAVKIFQKSKTPLALLQTTSTYPSQFNEIKLGMIKKLEKSFNVPIGISDHSPGIYIPLAAVAKGACIIEKHFTLNKKMTGPDQNFSLNPIELSELVKGVRAVSEALGSTKIIQNNEKAIKKFAYASVVSIDSIKKNQILSESNISTKRPGTGKIMAYDFYKILGKKAKHNISKNKQLSWSDVK